MNKIWKQPNLYFDLGELGRCRFQRMDSSVLYLPFSELLWWDSYASRLFLRPPSSGPLNTNSRPASSCTALIAVKCYVSRSNKSSLGSILPTQALKIMYFTKWNFWEPLNVQECIVQVCRVYCSKCAVCIVQCVQCVLYTQPTCIIECYIEGF